MPQMAPMWWATLFMMFSSCFIIMIMIVYYNMYLTPLESEGLSKNIQKLNWKW
uniref:ATP synthase complex subunit 8 n=1 Tax=Coleoptera sp. 1 KM-2017 TaxID=2219312 RepID=A0A346RG64_9COLE|nr:ATP synthase F0 subunit 8 [Coleoptera sp. 1 KM-2017]